MHPFLIHPVELPNPGAYAYRYTDRRHASGNYDMDGDCIGIASRWTTIYLERFVVLRFTNRGFWIQAGYDGEKFICHHWRKKFAHLNLEDAQRSYLKRKQTQRSILARQLKSCEAVLQSIAKGEYDTGKRLYAASEFMKGLSPREKMVSQYDGPDWVEPN